ncbi:MAG: JAB domain-containing protein [Litorimonas sp.]
MSAPTTDPDAQFDDRKVLRDLLSGVHPHPDRAAFHLMETFSTFHHAVRADMAELVPLIGRDAANVLGAVAPATRALLRPVLSRPRDQISSLDAAKAWFASHLNGRRNEAGIILYLDKKNRLLAEDVHEGTIDRAPIYPREVIRRCLLLDATALLIAHNHPTGCTEPSEPDKVLTRALVSGLAPFDCTLHDHLIFGRGEPFSFRSAGLIRDG